MTSGSGFPPRKRGNLGLGGLLSVEGAIKPNNYGVSVNERVAARGDARRLFSAVQVESFMGHKGAEKAPRPTMSLGRRGRWLRGGLRLARNDRGGFGLERFLSFSLPTALPASGRRRVPQRVVGRRAELELPEQPGWGVRQ